MASFVVFNGQGLSQVCSDIGGLFGLGGVSLVSIQALYCLRSYGMVLLAAGVGATPAMKLAVGAVCQKKAGERLVCYLEPMMLMGLLLAVTAYLVDGSFNPFLYFRF